MISIFPQLQHWGEGGGRRGGEETLLQISWDLTEELIAGGIQTAVWSPITTQVITKRTTLLIASGWNSQSTRSGEQLQVEQHFQWRNFESVAPAVTLIENPQRILTLLTLSEAKGGGVSVRSLSISTSETYCKFISKISAWLGLPLDEGHSGGKEGLRKTNLEKYYSSPQRARMSHCYLKEALIYICIWCLLAIDT